MKPTPEMIEDLRLGAVGIRTWMPETLPANELGQVHFARALAEAAAEAIEAILPSLAEMPAQPVAVKPLEWDYNGRVSYSYCQVTNQTWIAQDARERAKADEERSTLILSALAAMPSTQPAAQPEAPLAMPVNPLDLFARNVDAWGAAEWFERLVEAVRGHDEARRSGDEFADITADTFKNIMTSSAFQLARDFEAEVRSALAAPTQSAPQPVAVPDGLEVLSGLSSYLGAGLGDETTTADEFDKRIRWGIDYMQGAMVRICADTVERLSKRPQTTWSEVKAAILELAVAPTPPADAQAARIAELLDDAEKLVLTAIKRMRAAHVACLDLTNDTEAFLRAKKRTLKGGEA